MSPFYYLRLLYSLDTLDTRFTTSSKTPLQETASKHGIDSNKPAISGINGDSMRRDDSIIAITHPPRWNTFEFYFYYVCFITIVPMMFKVPYEVSKPSDPQYPKFEPLLSNGWILGRKVDNSDAQYASFRDNIPYMAVVVLLHPFLRKFYNHLISPLSIDNTNPMVRAELRMKQRISYDVLFALVFLSVLHGVSAFKILLLLYLNYSIAKNLPKIYIPVTTWVFNLGILFANELYRGYPIIDIVRLFSDQNTFKLWALRIDSYGGLIPRWEILFNITILRLISFNLDYYWALDHKALSPVEKKQLTPETLSERDRINTPASVTAFSFVNYISYTLYSPLYLAGPILTFNDYVFQLRYPSPAITTSRTTLYGVRFILALLSMELIIHYIYAVAISKSNPDWSYYTPFQLSMLGYFSLHHIWLKLLLPWRFFRFWALLDGIDPPENMVRCVSDNYSMLMFWRGWHRSFNRWITRYIYIPLGGSGRGTSQVRSVANLLAVFTFVALWHDISLRLLTWSWLVVLFFLPEIILSKVIFPARAYKNRPGFYRILSGVGAVGTVLMMMAANLVGFAVGLDGLVGLATGIVSGVQGWAFLMAACATLFVGIMVMFEIREDEKRRGIKMSC